MIRIELDRPRNISFPVGSIRAGKKYFNRGLISMMSVENAGPDAVIDILWIGLIHEDPRLTINDLDRIVGEWIKQEGNNYDVLQNAILEAMIEDKALNFPGAAEKNLKGE